METDKQQKIIIYKANGVRESINQLLMYLGANNDAKAIIQKMDELDGRIADLDDYVYKCYVDRGSNREQESLNPNLVEY